MSVDIDWSSLVFDHQWMARLERLAFKRFGQSAIADEAVNYVLEHLSEHHWQRLSSFSGKAQPATYLNAVAANLIEEFSRRKFGRPRPPVWLERNGNLWVSIWRQICLERQAIAEVVSRWCSAERTQEYLEDIVRAIKGRMPWCGVKHEEIPASCFEREDESAAGETVDEPVSESADEQAELEETLLVMRMLLQPDTDLQPLDGDQLERVSAKLSELKQQLNFSEQDLLILRMVYIEGIKQKQVAASLGMQGYQLSKRLKSIMRGARDAFVRAGFDEDQLMAWLAG